MSSACSRTDFMSLQELCLIGYSSQSLLFSTRRLTRIRCPPRHERSSHFQYVPSWVSESGAGQSLNVGQPTGSCVPTGEPVRVTFSSTAPAPLASSWSGQSFRAKATP